MKNVAYYKGAAESFTQLCLVLIVKFADMQAFISIPILSVCLIPTTY